MMENNSRHPELDSGSSRSIKGFTLIELLVVVIIIAVLTAVAMPMYKRAVLKSRFSTVMPMAKAVADAQEVYYLSNGQYALDKESLDITATDTENTAVALSTQAEENNYAYVAANRTDYPSARYIIYQKHSPKFAGNIHCEASDEEAQWLCEKGLGGQFIDGSISGNAKTYVLKGSTSGESDYFPQACSGTGEKACSCGGPVTGSCNDRTGTWSYENDCPTPLPDETVACGSGRTGNKTRHGDVCSGGTYTYGAWDESNCRTVHVSPSQWGDWTTCRNLNCEGDIFSGDEAACEDEGWPGNCNNATFSGWSSYCYATIEGGCSNGDFSGFGSVCYGGYWGDADICLDGNYSGQEAHCDAYTAGSCNGSTFYEGTYCAAWAEGSCADVTYEEGSWCDGDYCPAGSPKQGGGTW